MSDNLQQAADREGGSSSANSLLRIVGLVFLVAFVLLTFSFLMEHRLDELHESVSSLKTVEEERQALRTEVDQLKVENAELQLEVNALNIEKQTLRTQVEELKDELNRLQLEGLGELGEE